MTCLIVDDEPLARNLLEEYVKKVPSLELKGVCSNALDAMETLRQKEVDLLFLDIQMPELTGLTLLKIVKKRPLVILTTAYSQYALESYELDVVDYLLKPITLERFLQAVDKVSQRLNKSPMVPVPAGESVPFIFVKDGTKMVRIRIADILYVEGLKDYVTIYTRTQKIVSLQRIKSLEEQLPAERFIRIHHSYIIALDAIDSIQKGNVQIGSVLIPVSDSYKKSFREFIERNQIQ